MKKTHSVIEMLPKAKICECACVWGEGSQQGGIEQSRHAHRLFPSVLPSVPSFGGTQPAATVLSPGNAT